MQAIKSHIWTAIFAGLGAVVAAGPAMATAVPGTHCKLEGPSNRAGVSNYTWSLKNESSPTMLVLCPVIRTKHVTTSFIVRVDTDKSMTCHLYSHNSDGSLLGSSVRTGRNPVLSLNYLQVPSTSSQTVACHLPTNSAIYGIRTEQW
jgi:hypothetical protein